MASIPNCVILLLCFPLNYFRFSDRKLRHEFSQKEKRPKQCFRHAKELEFYEKKEKSRQPQYLFFLAYFFISSWQGRRQTSAVLQCKLLLCQLKLKKIDKSNQGDWPWNNKLKPIVLYPKNIFILFWYYSLFLLLIIHVVEKA